MVGTGRKVKSASANTGGYCRFGLSALAFVALCVAASPVGAAIAVDNATTAQIPSTSPNPFTFSHTTSGNDRLLLVSVASQPNDDDGIVEAVTGITYGVQPLTLVGPRSQCSPYGR